MGFQPYQPRNPLVVIAGLVPAIHRSMSTVDDLAKRLMVQLLKSANSIATLYLTPVTPTNGSPERVR